MKLFQLFFNFFLVFLAFLLSCIFSFPFPIPLSNQRGSIYPPKQRKQQHSITIPTKFFPSITKNQDHQRFNLILLKISEDFEFDFFDNDENFNFGDFKINDGPTPLDSDFNPDFGMNFDEEPDLFTTSITNYADKKWIERYGSKYLPMIDYLQSVGFQDHQINTMLKVCPDEVFQNNTATTLQEKITYLEQKFYLKGSTLAILVYHLPFILNKPIEGLDILLQKFIRLLETKGLNLIDIVKEDLSEWESWPPPVTPPQYTERI